MLTSRGLSVDVWTSSVTEIIVISLVLFPVLNSQVANPVQLVALAMPIHRRKIVEHLEQRLPRILRARRRDNGFLQHSHDELVYLRGEESDLADGQDETYPVVDEALAERCLRVTELE